MIRYLRKLKYEINYFFKPPLSIPDNFEEGTWKQNSDIYDLFKMMSKKSYSGFKPYRYDDIWRTS